MKYFRGLSIVFLIILFSFNLSWSATYYMRADGTAANKAAATGPCATVGNCMSIATHNADTFSGDDIIYLCDDGGTYRAQLTIPSSGTSGHVITYTAASGDTPIIKGSDIISSWTNVTGYAIKETFGDPSDDYYPSGYAVWYANRFTPASSYTLTRVGVVLKIGGGAPCSNPLTGYIYSDNGSGTPDAAIGTALATIQPTLTGSYVYYYFDFAGVALTNGTIYWVVIKTALDETNYMFVGEDAGGASGVFCKKSLNAVDWINGDTNAQPTVRTYTSGATLVWQATVTTEPKVVWLDNVAGTKETALGNLDAEHEWFWAANVLYIYHTGDPSASHTIEAGSRTNCIYTNAKNYLKFENLDIRHSAGATEGVGLNIGGGSNEIEINSCDFSQNGYQHIGVWGAIGAGSNFYIRNNNFAYSGLYRLAAGTGSAIDVDSTANNVFTTLVENNTFTHIGDYTGSGYHDHGIYFKDGNLIYRYNTHSNGGTETGAAVKISGNADSAQIYYNIITSGGGTQVWGVLHEAAISDVTVYNNVFYDCGIGIWQYTGGTGITIKNNIFYAAPNRHFYAQVTTGWVSDYNDFYGGSVFRWEETNYNFADWKTASSQDANSISTDPLFVSTGTDFHLQPTSPCINAGIEVGLKQDYAGKAVPAKHRAVRKVDMGAYEYQYRFGPD